MTITSITLSGFQIFDTPQTISLGRLTFLFGPNSAGKSAVEDALLFLARIIKGEEFTKSGYRNRFEALERDWRKTGPTEIVLTSTFQEYCDSMSVGIALTTPIDVYGLFGSDSQLSLRSRAPSTKDYPVEITWTYHLVRPLEEGRPTRFKEDWLVTKDFQISLDDHSLLFFSEGGLRNLGINFEHPAFLRSPKIISFLNSLPQDVDAFEYNKGWLYFKCGDLSARIEENKIQRDVFWVYWAEEFPESEDELSDCFEFFADIFDDVYGLIMGNMVISTDLVPASRLIPSQRDLTLYVDTGEAWDGDARRTWGYFDVGDPRYTKLAKSFLCTRFPTRLKQTRLEAGLQDLSKRVNNALTDHLFMERGYRLDFDYRAILEDEQYQLALDGFVPDSMSPGLYFAGDVQFLVRIFLVDSQGRRFSFNEVGSGLGYVLPVLCSIFETTYADHVSVIQQPELHLHPALQSALSDTFIEAINVSPEKQILVETHSEHLLLRVLRRIRQHKKPSNVNDVALAINPSDVVVAYFNPNPDGSTTVRRIRIGEDGDFLDRWPRGFFEERARELFDE